MKAVRRAGCGAGTGQAVFWRWLVAWGTGLVVAGVLWPQNLSALSTNRPSQKIPTLRPPQDIMTPTFWEQHGGAVLLATLAVLAGIGWLIWWMRRPKLVVVVPPEVVAKRALESLRGRDEDVVLVSAVSQNLRRYVQAVLKLPADEWTTDELLGSLAREARITPDLLAAVKGLLRECEARAFAPVPPPRPPALVDRALGVVGKFEALGAPVVGKENAPSTRTLTPALSHPMGEGESSDGLQERSPRFMEREKTPGEKGKGRDSGAGKDAPVA